MKTQCKIDLLGCSFIIQSDAPPEKLERIVEGFEQKIIEISRQHPNLEALKIALLAGLNLAEELDYFKSQAQAGGASEDQALTRLNSITQRLIDHLDSILANEEELNKP